MGMIFPWRLVRQGLVPTANDFVGVARSILDVVEADRVFKGAAFVGSLARGDLHPRSDLDLILVAYDRQFSRAKDLERSFQRLAAAKGIPLDSRLWSSSHARLGRHDYGPSYLETLPRVSTQFSVGVPLAECFRVPVSSVQGEMLAKMEHKLHSTRTRAGIFLARHHDDPDAVELWLQNNWGRVVRPLRVHITIGRRLLWWLHGTLPDDGKAAVIAQFLSEETFAPLHDDYSRLVDVDYQYDELLSRACSGSPRRDRYLLRVGNLLMENFRVSLRLLSDSVSLIRGAVTQAA